TRRPCGGCWPRRRDGRRSVALQPRTKPAWSSCPPAAGCLAVTRAADAHRPSGLPADAGVGLGELVAVFAVGLPGERRHGSGAPHYVLAACDRFEVRWVPAGLALAEVV